MAEQTTAQEPVIRNGVNLDELRKTIRAIEAQPGLAQFQFRATNRWISGGHNRTTIKEFSGAGARHRTDSAGFQIDADEPPVLLGQLFRLLGSDGVIYPNAGGRFPFAESTCLSINAALRRPWGSIAPAFPVPGGGIDVRRAGHWVDRYGPDTVLLIGGSLYSQPDLVAACRDIASTLI